VKDAMIRILYKPVSMIVGMLSGMLARAIVMRIWKAAAHEDEVPRATDARRSWAAVLLAAAVQGTVYAVVKAAFDRGAAEGFHKLTGFWPGTNGESIESAEHQKTAV
jgi:hypothetical protein